MKFTYIKGIMKFVENKKANFTLKREKTDKTYYNYDNSAPIYLHTSGRCFVFTKNGTHIW